MTDTYTLVARAPLGGASFSLSDSLDVGGTTHLVEITDLSIIAIGKPRLAQSQESFAALIEKTLGVSHPMMGQANRYQDAWLMSHSPDQDLLMLPRESDGDADRLQAILSGSAYVNDQSDAWAVLNIRGSLAVPALQRLIMLDIGGASQTEGSCSRTMMMHMGVVLLRRAVDDFVLLVPRSMAADAWHHMELSLKYVQQR